MNYLPSRARRDRHARPAPPMTARTALAFSGVGCCALQEFPWAKTRAGTARTTRATMQMRFTNSSWGLGGNSLYYEASESMEHYHFDIRLAQDFASKINLLREFGRRQDRDARPEYSCPQ